MDRELEIPGTKGGAVERYFGGLLKLRSQVEDLLYQ
jgi:hypothetical protein